jgi:polyhydroxyalkanoate synthesis regulator phasin
MRRSSNIEEQVSLLLQKTASNGKLSKKAARLLVDVVKSQLEVADKARKEKLSKQFVRDALLVLSLAKEVVLALLQSN